MFTFSSGLLFESGGADGSSFAAGALGAGGGGAELAAAGGAAAGAAFSAAGGGAAAGASALGAAGAAAAGAASAFGAAASGFFSSFFLSPPAPSIFAASAAVGKSALIVAVLKGTRFFFSFKNQLLNPPTYKYRRIYMCYQMQRL